jgi:hypothetical protein
MKKNIRLIGLGVVVTSMLAVSGVALADRTEKSCNHDRKTSKSAMHDGHIEKLHRIKEQLKLTQAQQPLWDSFIATPTHGDHARMDTRSTADRLKMMKENMEMMYGQRLVRIESMQALYAALDTSQQAIFDKALKHSRH